MNRRDLSEREICSQCIGPAIEQGGWDRKTQVRKKASFAKGRIIVRGKLVSRGNRGRYTKRQQSFASAPGDR